MSYTFIEITWMFLAYALIGWLWETPYVSIKEKKYVNRGFLRGPLIPIYGFAATTVMLSMSFIEPLLVYPPAVNVLISMFYIAVVASIWEYVTSFAMESLFKTRWWDYSERKFNLKGRIALDISVFWGLGGFILWRFVNVHIMNFYHFIPTLYANIFLSISYLLICVDGITTVIELVSVRNLELKLQDASEELITAFVEKMDTLSDNIEGLTDSISTNLEEQKQSLLEKFSDAKSVIKGKIPYRRIEGFSPFSEFLDEMLESLKSKANEAETSLSKFSDMLMRLKGKTRFFQKYPEARTRQFEKLYLTRMHLLDKKKANASADKKGIDRLLSDKTTKINK